MACEIKEVSKAGLEFIVTQEGIKLKPYKDSAGIATIGVGSTYYENGKRVKMTDPVITTERAIQLFMNILTVYEKAVWSMTVDSLSHQQFDALTSFTYNLGVSALKNSTLLKLVNKNPDNIKIKNEFMKWIYAGGKKVKGLEARRKREAALYFS